MACWYFCSLCREGVEKNSAVELLEHIMKAHKCNGWSKYNGQPKKKCLIEFHFDVMNPQERICTSLQPVNIQCKLCDKYHNFSVDYVNCVQRHVLEDSDSQSFRDEFPSQDNQFLLNAAESVDASCEMLSQDDQMLDMCAGYVEELIQSESHETVQQLLNGKFFSKKSQKFLKLFFEFLREAEARKKLKKFFTFLANARKVKDASAGGCAPRPRMLT